MDKDKKGLDRLINYWKVTAEKDFDTMKYLFKGRKYSDALFFGHIVLEKILKAVYVKQLKKHAPYSHDLIYLFSDLNSLNLTSDEVKLLKEVKAFNVRGRYPDVELEFYKKADMKYTKYYIDSISKLYKKLCQNL